MSDVLSLKRAKTDQISSSKETIKTSHQGGHRSVDLTCLPLWTQAWGKGPPPGLRLSTPQFAAEQLTPMHHRLTQGVQRQETSQERLHDRKTLEPEEEDIPSDNVEFPLQRDAASPVSGRENQLAQCIQAARGTGHPLEGSTQRTLERGLGADLCHVRVHTDAEADRLSRSVNATAFTTGADIFFRRGMYCPSSSQGLHLLAHEATHVVQQATGPVTGTPTAGGISISDAGDRFEQAADKAADRVMATTHSRDTTTAYQAESIRVMLASGTRVASTQQGQVAIQRRIGLELELNVPVDGYGEIEDEEQKLLAGQPSENYPDPNSKEAKEEIEAIMEAANLDYGHEIKEGNGFFKVVADKGQAAIALRKMRPPKALSTSIIELVMEPPVSTEEELKAAIESCIQYCDYLDDTTQRLTTRADIGEGYYAGPLNSGKSKPEEINFDAGVQVNIGVDPRRFHELLGWYAESNFEPSKGTEKIDIRQRMTQDINKALSVGKDLAKQFREESTPEQLTQGQNFDSIQSLATAVALYLVAGENEAELETTNIKNFTPVLFKTRLSTAYNDLTKEEHLILERKWEQFRSYLVHNTRYNEDLKQILIKRKRKGKPALSKHTVGSFFEYILDSKKPPIVIAPEAEIQPDPVGPVRDDGTLPKDPDREPLKDEDKKLLNRRRAMVMEFRVLPRKYKKEEWFGVGKAFLDAAEKINMRE